MKYFLMMLCVLGLMAAPARAAEDLMAIYKTYEGDTNVGLDKAHRSQSELIEWLTETTASALAFAPGKTAEKLLVLRPLFSEAGYKAYTDFLTALGFGPALESKTLALGAIVDSAPLLIAQGNSTGRYAWAYEVPVVLSMPGKPGEPVASKSITLRIQFGRSAKGVPPHGVLIENWQLLNKAPAAAATPPPQESGGQPVILP